MTERRTYLEADWADPRVAVRNSPIAGLGTFTTGVVEVGEVLFIWGGHLFSLDDLPTAEPQTIAAIDERLFLAAHRGTTRSSATYTNHSCDPTLWLKDEVTLIARRPLIPGDELTLDYATFEGQEEFVVLRSVAAAHHCVVAG